MSLVLIVLGLVWIILGLAQIAPSLVLVFWGLDLSLVLIF